MGEKLETIKILRALHILATLGAIADETEMNNILPDRLLRLWNDYIKQREKGLKKEANKLLSDFIDNLEQLDNSEIENYVFFLTDMHRIEKLNIDFRLFERIILPVLIKGIKSYSLTTNRRLAQFDQIFWSSNSLLNHLKNELDYQNDSFEPADFYKKEIELNNSDLIAVDGFLDRVAWGLNYAIHELPELGLIWDVEIFESELTEFKKYQDLSPNKIKWNAILKQWDFVLKTWKDYLEHEKEYNNYKDYLDKNNLKYEQATAPNSRYK